MGVEHRTVGGNTDAGAVSSFCLDCDVCVALKEPHHLQCLCSLVETVYEKTQSTIILILTMDIK